MDFGDLFVRAMTLTWRHKFLWLLGLLLGINGLAFSLMRVFARAWLPAQWLDMAYWLELLSTDPATLMSWPMPDLAVVSRYAGVGIVALFVYVIGFWLVVTVAEGGVITAVLAERNGQSVTFGGALRGGFGLLGRFAGIDAAVFLPWFVVALLAMLLALAVMVATLAIATQDVAVQWVVTFYVVGLLCVVPLGCLLLPLGMASTWYRNLAFRDAAVLHHGVRVAVRHTWVVVRAHLGDVLVLTALLLGVGYVVRYAVGFLSVPLLALTAVALLSGPLLTLLNVLVTLLIALLKGMVLVFTAVAWTLAYWEITTPLHWPAEGE